MKQLFSFIIMSLWATQLFAGGRLPTPDTSASSNIYVISVGINNYPYPLVQMKNAVGDSKAILDKIVQDNPRRSLIETQRHNKTDPRLTVGSDIWFPIDSVYTYWLYQENATYDSIKSAFDEVAQRANPDDYFIFFFAGISLELHPFESFILPDFENIDTLRFDGDDNAESDYPAINNDNALNVAVLAGMMEKIQCRNQLVISEAGDGSSFASNLIAALFESNPLVAEATDRNRIILTTKALGLDNMRCKGIEANHGPLTHYILSNENIMNVFVNSNKYELNLSKSEIECPILESKYFDLYKEKNYQKVLLSNHRQNMLRGGAVEEFESLEYPTSDSSITHALIVATNDYNPISGWSNLSNPINDAEKVSELLSSKYGVKIHKAYNMPKDSILAQLIAIKHILDENDKFIFFIAGHGYYSNNFTDGYLVLTNSSSLNSDFTLNSYLQMATLNRLLDNMPTKSVFAIFDVCFGASFDLKAKDLAINDYKNLRSDISIREFENRKSKYYSRIFLASGKYTVPDYWTNTLQHSPFAEKLIYTLNKEKNFITPGKLYTAMEGNITEPFLKQFGQQEPRGDFILPVIRK